MRYLLTLAALGFMIFSMGCLGGKKMTKVELGKHLYFDTRLSADDSVSCNTCHDVTNKKGGVDGLATSTGINGQKGGRNAPTVWNATFLSVQFWDGRADSLADQAKGPITNPIEMGMPDHDTVIAKLKKIPGYVSAFEQVYGKDSLNIDNLANAIAAFEETLTTLNSPYDKFMAGDNSAMSKEAKVGFEKFKTSGCVACHQGDHFAGPKLPVGQGFYQKFPTFPDSEYVAKYSFMKDEGRFEVTKADHDKHMYRVPTLRNIAITGPYFHNGAVASLNEAIKVMAKTQLNIDLSDEDASSIEVFLNALTGDLPSIKAPKPLN